MSVFILLEVGISFNVKVYIFIINMSSSFLNLDLSKENFSLKYSIQETSFELFACTSFLAIDKAQKEGGMGWVQIP